ncbi:ribonuclease P protein subunit p38-like isoform X1 [Cyprinus carpio]|uniref:Ribonuclease P protein subunit p38-like isoform X1 n=2 Tax=Cyprinus carpio TaxID=7962 RepID=A0A9Q9YY59_CYPCA|nr:ribonuclease P protein subunit p38-like isoform X1 [Cyprinus carpio]XP_042628558.1 ribonuclease P protein subunit p38-like isoform X1 [Cyprinus carpio]XP_042628559.1 ribonuclease P protein subunit p38-like isoform X1 [Cyprinus carpio]XP_042628560.1 ribonuclease P protein subunit p38-like isoform X1 [Cyprinus carpio]XP_042628561.1 ribonuclease P protein subunit p38-like isoform X1 [Cyprinus carpio]
MSTPGKGATKKEKKKPIPVKTSLNSPYSTHWSPLEREHKHFILNTLKGKLSAVGLQKQRSRGRSRKKGSKPTEDQKPAPDPAGRVQTPSKPTEPCWTNPAVRKQLAVGINEVTKGLERNELSLVLVCNSVRPAHMTCHLIPLSKTRSVPACQVPSLSESLAGLLGLKCVLALGFRRGAEVFEEVVRAITPVVPPLRVAWIPTDSTAKAEEKLADTLKGQKRKLEDMSDEATGASPLNLQPLKVKKIIPNPTKIKKPKKKGKQKCLSSV